MASSQIGAGNLPSVTAGAQSAPTASSASGAAMATAAPLLARIRSGAHWFYWIAGLSLVNSVVAMSGNGTRFVVGLGMTQVVDMVARHAGGAAYVPALVINIMAAGLFVLFGVFASRRSKAAFVVGMALYAADALLLLMFGAILSVGFHGLALYYIYRGFAAAQNYRQAMEFQQTA